MPNILIVYASLTGATEEMAKILSREFNQLNVENDVRQGFGVHPHEYSEYDICILGTYTYGADGDIPEEMEDFFFDLAEIDLTGKVFGVFGSGDKIYEKYCQAVIDFDKQFEQVNAIRGAQPVLFELRPDEEDKKNIQQFAKDVLKCWELKINS